MPPGPALALVLALALAGCGGDGGGPDGGAAVRLGFPTEASFYHGLTPRTGPGEDDVDLADVAAYEAAVDRRAAWVAFAHNWYVDAAFPAELADAVRDTGALPWIRLMTRSSAAPADGPDPVYALASIAAGDHDAALIAWADAAAAHGDPIVVEWGSEPNLDRHPWSARWNGEDAGAGAYVAAYRHVHGLVAARAPNVTWAWRVAPADAPAESWNELERYFPGADVVDWLAVSAFGARTPDDAGAALRDVLDPVVPRLAELAPARPLMLAEMGATAGHPTVDPIAWAEEAVADLLAVRWPAVRGFAWRDDDDPATSADMRIGELGDLAGRLRGLIRSNTSIYDRPILY